MTDEEQTTEEEAPAPETTGPTPEEILAKAAEIDPDIAKILQEIEQEDVAKEQASAAEEEANAKMNAAKQVCFDTCGKLDEAIAAARDPRVLVELHQLQADRHAEHADALAAAHREFSGQREGESNPATPGEVTELSADITVLADTVG